MRAKRTFRHQLAVRNCEWCGGEISFEEGKKPNHYARQRFCSVPCRNHSRAKPKDTAYFRARSTENANTGCWEWTGYCDAAGYGRVAETDGEVLTHRLAYIAFIGPIPDGLCVLHKCDNPPCCNPAHFFLGTLADNNYDKIAKGRERGAPGEANTKAKLTAADVTAIRASRHDRGSLAAKFGVTTATISHIQRRVTWRHLP